MSDVIVSRATFGRGLLVRAFADRRSYARWYGRAERRDRPMHPAGPVEAENAPTRSLETQNVSTGCTGPSSLVS